MRRLDLQVCNMMASILHNNTRLFRRSALDMTQTQTTGFACRLWHMATTTHHLPASYLRHFKSTSHVLTFLVRTSA